MNKLLLKKVLIISMITILSIGMFACTKDTEGLVGEVNGISITEEEFNGDYAVFKNLYERQLGEDALEQVGEDGRTLGEVLKGRIFEKLVIEKLVSKESEDLKIVVTEEEVAKKLEEYINDMEGQENFDKFLSSNNLTKEFFEANMRKELLVDKHKQTFLDSIVVTDEDANEYFEDNKAQIVVLNASHILVATEVEAENVLERLNNGEDFATVATLESLDSVSAAKGGELGEFTKGQMISEFEDAAFALEEGQTSGLVKSEVGYHIIHINERKDTFDELKDDIIEVLKENEYMVKIQKLRSNAKVENYIDTTNK